MAKDLHALLTRLRQARVAAGLSVPEAAAKARVSVDTLKNWEHRGKEPGSLMLARMADVYGVSVDWLVGLSSAKTAPGCVILNRPMVDRILSTTDEQELLTLLSEEVLPIQLLCGVPDKATFVGWGQAGDALAKVKNHIETHAGEAGRFWEQVGERWLALRKKSLGAS